MIISFITIYQLISLSLSPSHIHTYHIGLYQKGYQLYLESQVLYTSINHRNPNDRALYEGYGVADKALIDLALQCCAKCMIIYVLIIN